MSYNPFDDFEDKPKVPAGGAGFSYNVAEIAEEKPKVQLNVAEVIPTKDEKDLKIEMLEKHILELYETLMIPSYNNKISAHTTWIYNLKASIERLKKGIELNLKVKDEKIYDYNLLIKDMKAREEIFIKLISKTNTFSEIDKISKDILNPKIIEYRKKGEFHQHELHTVVTGYSDCCCWKVYNYMLDKLIKSEKRQCGAYTGKEETKPIWCFSNEGLIESKELVFEAMNEKIEEYNENIKKIEKKFVEEDERLKKELKVVEENLIKDEEKLMKEIKEYEGKIRKIKDGLF
jgi:hypothetical protein